MAGGENIGAKGAIAWIQFSIEEVVAADAEIIIMSTAHGSAVTPTEEIKGHPAWRETTAVKGGEIHLIDADLVSRYGPRVVLALEKMAKMIHPELFEQ